MWRNTDEAMGERGLYEDTNGPTHDQKLRLAGKMTTLGYTKEHGFKKPNQGPEALARMLEEIEVPEGTAKVRLTATRASVRMWKLSA